MVRLVVRVCHLRGFRLPWCPRACRRQALALYYTLTRLRYPVTIRFGVHKAGEALRGHSWVTVQGQRVAEATPGVFHGGVMPLYTFHTLRLEIHQEATETEDFDTADLSRSQGVARGAGGISAWFLSLDVS